MDEKTIRAEGIVLATTDFGDAHRVVTIYTKEFGKLEVNAYGCRRPRSRLAAPTLMFNHVSVELLRGAKVDMIRDAEMIDFFPITDDLTRIAYASLLFEIVNHMTPLCQKDEAIFFILLNALKTFVKRNPRAVAVIATAQFIAVSGVMLRLDRCIRCNKIIDDNCAVDVLEGGALCHRCHVDAINPLPLTLESRALVENMIAFDWDEQSHLTLRAEAFNDVENIMLAHVRTLVEFPLRSLKFLNQLRALPAPA